jgi:hypothetical protein
MPSPRGTEDRGKIYDKPIPSRRENQIAKQIADRQAADAAREAALEQADFDNYRKASTRVQELLSSHIQYNPAVTNYALSLDFPSDTQSDAMMGSMTNLPNTLYLGGHGNPKSPRRTEANPSGTYGISPDKTLTNELANAVRDRRLLSDTTRAYRIAPTKAGLTMGEIAQNLKGATNDIKRVVLMSCYRAGYDPAEIKSYFPNVEQIIASREDQPTSKVEADTLFKGQRDPADDAVDNMLAGMGMDLNLYNYAGGQTNPIHQTSDWLTNPPPNFKYLPHIGQTNPSLPAIR